MRRATLRNSFLMAVAIVIIVVLYATLTYHFVPNDEPAVYTVTIQDKDLQAVTIEASFILQDQILLMAPEASSLYGQFVKNLQATDQSEQPIMVESCAMWQIFACNLWRGWEGQSKWHVDAAPGDLITIRYDIDLKHETADFPGGTDTAAFATEWGLFATGRSLFVMNGQPSSEFVAEILPWLDGWVAPREDSRQQIEVNFNLPDGWKVTVPWQQSANNQRTYVARDMIDLSESMMFVGTHHEFTTQQSDTEIVWAFSGQDILAEKEALSQAAERFFNYYTDLMGGLPLATQGEPFPKVVVIITEGHTDGEVIDRNIALIFDRGSDFYGLNEVMIGNQIFHLSPIHLIAHEFFHLWNGKSIDSAPEGEWFGEGLTDYNTIRVLHRFGYFDEATCFEFLRQHYRLYTESSGYGEVSIQDAGSDKGQYRGLVYGGGMFAGLTLDLIIRHETNNQKSFDDLMRGLYADYAGTGRLFTSTEIQARAETLSGKNLDNFFNRYIYGTKRVPVETYLPYAGLQADINDTELILSRRTTLTELEQNIHSGIFGE
ncbi:MAG: hypothetical protein AAF629_07445 [Chloroflexota bacterium]